MNDENPATIVTGFSLVGEGCAKLFRNALPRLLRCVHSHRFICALAENSPPDCFLIACLRIHLLPFCCGKKLRNTLKGVPKFWWEKVDSNHRSMTQQIYSLPPLATREFSHIQLDWWSWWTDSNPRPADYKSAALPTELHQRFQVPI